MANRWIVSSHRFREHKTVEAAQAEMARLVALTGKEFRLIRIKNSLVPDEDETTIATHTQWEVIMGALEKWTKEGGSQLVALGIIGQGLLILDELRRAALAKAEGRT